MKLIVTVSVVSALLITAFVISFNWSSSIDYSPVDASMIPLAITWLIGVFAFSSLGGIIGAIWEYKEAN